MMQRFLFPMIETSNTVFVFDLDDTLYQEADYKASGLRHLVKDMETFYGIQSSETLLSQLKENTTPIDKIFDVFPLPHSMKESFLWQYRLHRPTINLNPGVAELLSDLQQYSKGVAILTDGRSLTQRLKLKALGLEKIPNYISEEYGAEKPESSRFELIEDEFKGCVFVYVGDNPKKDFIAPNKLGWHTFCVKSSGNNIHSQNCDGLPANCHPAHWLENITEIKEFLC